MSDQNGRPARIPEAAKTGKLPGHRPERMWGGPGSGATCALCGKAIATDDVELELQFASGQGFGGANYHVHVQCFAAWELGRRNAGLNGHTLPLADHGGIMPSREPNTTSDWGRD